jgi:hypothetical protein
VPDRASHWRADAPGILPKMGPERACQTPPSHS